MTICIDPKIIKRLKKTVDDGELDVQKFLEKDITERIDWLKKYIGEKEAEHVNEFVVKRFKSDVSEEMFEEISTRFNKINKLRGDSKPLSIDEWKNMKKNKTPPKWALEYVDMQDDISRVLNPNNEFGFFKSIGADISDEWHKVLDAEGLFDKTLMGTKFAFELLTSPVYKSIKASFDMSYALRQGFKILTNDILSKGDKQWKNSFEEAWSVWKSIGSKKEMDAVMREFKATYMAHPHYQLLKENGLDFGVIEEFFPTTLAQKTILGNIFKASDEAFTVFSQSSRFGIASDLLEKQLSATGKITKEQVKSITQFANSVTGRGSLGKLEAYSNELNKLFFSARFIRSQFDTFAMPFNKTLSKEVQREAKIHAVKTLGMIGAMVTTASMFTEVELDPRSSNFGKMKVGDKTWVDLTAGLGSYIALATKIATRQAKSAKTGKVSKLNTGKYGAREAGDVLSEWFQNKLAPAPGALNTLFLRGRDFKGDKPTLGSVAVSIGVPISLENIWELMETEDGATIVAAWVADVLGMSSTTFK